MIYAYVNGVALTHAGGTGDLPPTTSAYWRWPPVETSHRIEPSPAAIKRALYEERGRVLLLRATPPRPPRDPRRPARPAATMRQAMRVRK